MRQPFPVLGKLCLIGMLLAARATAAGLEFPSDVAVDGDGNLYIADTDNNRIRRVDPSGIITTIAGTGEAGFSGDSGPATEARLNRPHGLAVDDAGNLYVADTGNNRIRRVDPSGTIVTVAGTRVFHVWRGGFSGDGGPAVAAELHYPQGVAVDGAGNLYIKMAGLDNGYVKVERVEGTAPFYAYGVINDNFNSDGSFVFPVREDSLVGKRGQPLPVIIETGTFNSELTVTNFSPVTKTVDFRFVAEAIETADDTASFSLELKAGEQQILPHIVNWLRQQEVALIGAEGSAFVGAVFATVADDDMSGIAIGARTGAPDKKGGQYSLFYNGVPYGSASIDSAWIYGLQQNEENPSNVALVNTGEVDDSISTFEIDVFEIDHYSRAISRGGFPAVRTLSKTVGPRGWLRINRILGDSRQGYVQVRKVSGNNPFITYGVINDGGAPGERSGDGAYLPAQD